MLVSELGLETATEVVSVLDWEHLSLGHLRLSPTVRCHGVPASYPESTPPQGSVPVVVTPGGRPLAGEALLLHLHDLSITEPCNTGAVCVFPLAEVGFVI